MIGDGSTDESGEAISRKADKGTVDQALLPSDSPESVQVELDFVGHSLWINKSKDYDDVAESHTCNVISPGSILTPW